MKLFAAIIAAAALALGAADSCTLTTDAANGQGMGCAEIAKCVDSLTVEYSGPMGSIELPSGCAETGKMENVGVTASAIGGNKGTLTVAYAVQGSDITLAASLSGSTPASCTSTATVSAGSCLGKSAGPAPGPEPSGGDSAAAGTVASVAGIGAAAVAASAALLL